MDYKVTETSKIDKRKTQIMFNLQCDDCKYRCDGVNWTCVLVDENGWIVAGHWLDEDEITEEDPIRQALTHQTLQEL